MLGGTNTFGIDTGAVVGPSINGPLAKLDVDNSVSPNTPANADAANSRLSSFIQ